MLQVINNLLEAKPNWVYRNIGDNFVNDIHKEYYLMHFLQIFGVLLAIFLFVFLVARLHVQFSVF